MSMLLSMASFALVASISPGPVNIVALGAGAQYGFGASLRHVTGATLGFVLLLLLTGFGLQQLLDHWPHLRQLIQWSGVAFLFFMAYKLAADDGQLNTGGAKAGPSLLNGAAMQWLNPKAWLASVAGVGAYAADGNASVVWQFALLYCVICFASVACWAYAGTFLGPYLRQPWRVRRFNRLMALLLAAGAGYLVLD
jgi:threonine/homoserine/homoserine lactone efflux protein